MISRMIPYAMAAVLSLCTTVNGAIIATSYSPSVYDPNPTVMDAALGINGYTIEDFEDSVLIPGLSYELADPSAGIFTALPNTFTASGIPGGSTTNVWDGSRILLGNSNNSYPSEGVRVSTVTFHVAGGTTSFSVGLSSFQSSSPSSPQYPITNHNLYVNGAFVGLLESFPGWVPGLGKNAYLRFDATGGDVIHSVAFSNVTQTGLIDLLAFDHVAIAAVPEPSTARLASALAAFFGARRRMLW